MPPLCEKIQRMSGNLRGVAAEHEMRDGARRIGRVFDRPRWDTGHEAAAAVGRRGMHIDHRLAAVELFVDRCEGRIAEIFGAIAREQSDAVSLERVERVFDLLEAAVDVRRRNHGEQAEAAGMIAHRLGAELVEVARKLAGFVHVVAEPDAGLRDRQDRGCDAALVHLLDGQRGRPFRRWPAGAAAGRHQGVDVELRDEVVVHVDARLGAGACALAGRRPTSPRANRAPGLQRRRRENFAAPGSPVRQLARSRHTYPENPRRPGFFCMAFPPVRFFDLCSLGIPLGLQRDAL